MFLKVQLLPSGHFLVNYANSVLTIELHTTLFNNQDDFLGSLSYPGTLPLEDNRIALQNAHYMTTDSALRTSDAMLWLGSIPYKLVQFNFTIEDDKINYTLLVDNGTVASNIKNKLLAEIAQGSINDSIFFPNMAAFKAYATASAEAAPGDFPMVFFPFANDGAYSSFNPDNPGDYGDIGFPIERIMNRYEMDAVGNGSFTLNVDSSHIKQTYIPAFYITYILKRVIQFLGYQVQSSWIGTERANRYVLLPMIATPAPTIPDITYFTPAVTIAEFLKAIRTECGVLIDFDNTRKVAVIESLEILKATSNTVDLRNKQVKSYRETNNTITRYLVSQNPDDKDGAFSDQDKANLPKLSIGDPIRSTSETALTLVSVCTKMVVETAPSQAGITAPINANWRIPYVKQAIDTISPLNQLEAQTFRERDNFKLRLLLYHGMRPNDAGYLYPYASNDNIDVLNNIISVDTLSLNVSGSTFLSLKAYYEFMVNSKPFEMGFELTRDEFFNINASKRILVRDFNQATVSCLLDQIAADLGDKPSIFAKATLYPIVRPSNTKQIFPAIPITPGPTDPPVDNGNVYARLRTANIVSHHVTVPPPPYDYSDCEIWIDFFADAAGTTPKTVTSMDVRIRVTRADGVNPDQNTFPHFTSTGSSVELLSSQLLSSNQGGIFTTWAYTLLSSAHYTIIT